MEGVTLEQCEAALQTFYGARSEEQRVQAEAFLEHLRTNDTNLDLAFNLMSNKYLLAPRTARSQAPPHSGHMRCPC